MEQFDYIVAGGGLSGLSLILTMIKENALENKRLLLLEKIEIRSNDRTWCFWEKENFSGISDHLISKTWQFASINGKGQESQHDISPYRYSLIRGIDFYTYALTEIAKHNQIEVRNETIKSIRNTDDKALVQADNLYSAEWVFSSIMPRALIHQQGKHYLLQHFKGWWLTFDEPVFDEKSVTIFDFRCKAKVNNQEDRNAFMYILPLNPRQGLIEYTVFSSSLLKSEEYDLGLKNYIEDQFPLKSFKIDSVEEGIIPMTNHSFPSNKGRIVYLGTSGGQTKPSSGFTFKFIEKHSLQICHALKKTGKPLIAKLQAKGKFNFYDRVFLRILSDKSLSLEEVFCRLFRRNNVAQVFEFLDNETSLKQDIKIMFSLPLAIFSYAAIKEIFLKKT